MVGGRKHSAWNNGFRVILETGIYDSGGQFERSLGIVKTELNIPVNRDAATRTANFRKLMQEYGITGAVQDAFQNRIVDAETLRMKTLRVQPDRTKPCTSCDVKLNVAASDDTGLYELYTNVVFRFVEDMMARAEAFRDQSAPTNTDGRWVARSGDPVPTRGTDDVVFRDRDDQHRGVSYCFGCKQELETFNTAVSQFLPPDTAEVLAKPCYRGKLIDNLPRRRRSGRNESMARPAQSGLDTNTVNTRSGHYGPASIARGSSSAWPGTPRAAIRSAG